MNATKASIMITLFACMSQGKKHYSTVSVNKIRKLLERIHQIHVKRRWIFYCLSDLLENNLITRKGRYRNDDSGLIRQIPSMVSFTVAGMKYLVSKRVTGALKVLKCMMKYLLEKDGRWPTKKDMCVPKDIEQYSPTSADWSKLLGIVGKKI